MKPRQKDKDKRATGRSTRLSWQEMNRKQRRETMRKIQSEELSLEVIHPMPRALISATNPTMSLYRRVEIANRYDASGAPRRS